MLSWRTAHNLLLSELTHQEQCSPAPVFGYGSAIAWLCGVSSKQGNYLSPLLVAYRVHQNGKSLGSLGVVNSESVGVGITIPIGELFCASLSLPYLLTFRLPM